MRVRVRVRVRVSAGVHAHDLVRVRVRVTVRRWRGALWSRLTLATAASCCVGGASLLSSPATRRKGRR